MKGYNKNKLLSYLMYWDPDNLHGWAMSRKLPADNFEWGENALDFSEEFIKGYDESSDKGYIFKVDVRYPKNLHDLHSDLPLLLERMKVKKCYKLVCTFYDKEKYLLQIRTLKQELNHGVVLKKGHRIIKFNQKAWLEPYIDINTKLSAEAKINFGKGFFKLTRNSVFGKTMENVRRHTDKRRNMKNGFQKIFQQ